MKNQLIIGKPNHTTQEDNKATMADLELYSLTQLSAEF